MKVAILCIFALAGLMVGGGLIVAYRPGAYSGDCGNSMFGGIIVALGAIIGLADLVVALGWAIFR